MDDASVVKNVGAFFTIIATHQSIEPLAELLPLSWQWFANLTTPQAR
jgi:hypothetical protein